MGSSDQRAATHLHLLIILFELCSLAPYACCISKAEPGVLAFQVNSFFNARANGRETMTTLKDEVPSASVIFFVTLFTGVENMLARAPPKRVLLISMFDVSFRT